ncbi:hypothetical protein UMC2_34921 [[Clostridium] sordellii]|nr:hypothetical protein [Paeniclostridium sordellii]CEK34281.1 hypothetical protein UMC2_34921 [[Clostridium] sordellii] [Paeniclostridium sordellii]
MKITLEFYSEEEYLEFLEKKKKTAQEELIQEQFLKKESEKRVRK